MKKIFSISLVSAFIILFTSCGINNAIVMNHNQNTTQVQLTSNNYKVVDKISGSASVPYVLFFGGMNKTQLFENAYSNMVGKANLMNGSKALINIMTEEHLGGVPPFYYKRTVTVSAYVIEFIK